MTENDRDIELLHSKPEKLVAKHQKMIQAVAKTGLKNGWVPASEIDDAIQTISLELLGKMEAVRKNYDGRALLRTYLSQIAMNICKRYHKTKSPIQRSAESLDSLPSRELVFDGVLIDEARDRFRAILLLYGHRLPKILLFLKLFFRIPIGSGDVLKCYPQCRNRDLDLLLRLFSGDYSSMFDRQIMEILTPFVNKMEKSSTSPDAYRRWIALIIGEICDLLNGDPPTARFNRETVSLLFEDYCFRFSEKEDIRR
jgi:DNA-directed RNA polymerase specialized sigma24 family protein